MVKNISQVKELQDELEKNKLVVIDYWATWCGPCKNIAPFFEELSNKYEATFLKVDIDDAEELAETAGVQCLPTFQIYKNGNKVDEITGADKEKLENSIKSNLA